MIMVAESSVSFAEAARRVPLSGPTITRLVTEGHLKTIHVPGMARPRIPVSEVERLIAASSNATTNAETTGTTVEA